MSVALRDILDMYLELRKASGIKTPDRRGELSKFLDYLDQAAEPYLTYSLVQAWLDHRSALLSKYSLQSSYNLLQRFSDWAHSFDSRNQCLPKRSRRLNGRRTPIILNETMVASLMDEILYSEYETQLSNYTAATITGLLFSTGMRIGEALNLRSKDVNFDDLTIYISHGKTGRDRLLPIDETVADELFNYTIKRNEVFAEVKDKFFLFDHGEALSKHPFENRFRRACDNLGYRQPNQFGYVASSLRAHDLRHSYAVNSLIKCYREVRDISDEVPKLTVLMGHSSSKETYYYIEAVPDLIDLAMRRTLDAH